MSILKFSFLFFILFATNPISYGSISANKNLVYYPIPNTTTEGGVIVMDDVIMAITLNDENDNIIKIEIVDAYQELVLEEGSCGDYHCTHDLSVLSFGSYTVTVFTENNDSFSSGIEL